MRGPDSLGRCRPKGIPAPGISPARPHPRTLTAREWRDGGKGDAFEFVSCSCIRSISSHMRICIVLQTHISKAPLTSRTPRPTPNPRDRPRGPRDAPQMPRNHSKQPPRRLQPVFRNPQDGSTANSQTVNGPPKFRAHVWVASLGKSAPRSFYRKVPLESARPYLPQSGRVEGVLNHSATDSVALSLTFSGVPIPPRPPNRTRLRHRHKRSVSPRRPTSPEQTKRTEQR